MEANQKPIDSLILLANVLLALSALPTILLALETRRGGPEGPVGFHMITAPLALLQVIALAIAIHRGVFDFIPTGRPLSYGLLVPYFIGMTILPFFALERDFTGPLSKLGMVLVVAACFASVNRLPGMMLSSAVLSLACLGGITMVAAECKQYFVNAAATVTADRDRISAFEESQSKWQAEEWAKLPENPALWQLIQFTHPFNKEVKQQCLTKIAALPNLEQEIVKLLGTGWAEHALPYLVDHYTGRFAPFAPAYAEFLNKQFDHWEPQLSNNPHAGNWAVNLYRHFDVAERIVKDGGDLRAPLQRWLRLFEHAQGLGMLKQRVKMLLRVGA
ncbi:MAG: hypothetical protein JST93_12800 [Acidobacteria bacterium]|nr:hypothetical protein [Acidobacteriota bacterium]